MVLWKKNYDNIPKTIKLLIYYVKTYGAIEKKTMVLWKKTMILYRKPLNFDLLWKKINGTVEKEYGIILNFG